jgi:hypothetical protein
MDPPSDWDGEESASSGDGDAAVLLSAMADATVVAMRAPLLVMRAQCSAKTTKPPYSSSIMLVVVLVHLIVRSETALVA